MDQATLKSPKGQSDAQHLQSNEHRLIYSPDPPESIRSCLLSEFLLNCINCHVSTKIFYNSMVLWFCFLFTFLLNMGEHKHSIKVFNIYTFKWFCFLCQTSLMLGGFNSLTLSCWGGWLKSVPSKRVLTRVPSKFVEQNFLPIWQGNNGMGSFTWGMPRVYGICSKDELVTPKTNAWASTPIPHPWCCELAISRMKRGGVEVIMPSCIF